MSGTKQTGLCLTRRCAKTSNRRRSSALTPQDHTKMSQVHTGILLACLVRVRPIFVLGCGCMCVSRTQLA